MSMKRNGRGHFKAIAVYPLDPESPRARTDIPISELETVAVKLSKVQAARLIVSMVRFIFSEDNTAEVTGERESGFVRISSRKESAKR